MDLMKAIEIASQGMRAQGVRMKVISENLANAETTGQSSGADPYRRQTVTFKDEIDRSDKTHGVAVDRVAPDNSAFVLKFDPNHPAADSKGYVKMPNVNPIIEMMDMREAQRSYEANLGVIDVSKAMMMRTIDLLRA